jgi:hypothetical protein
MEGELDFLALLPIRDRQQVLDYWYRGRNRPQTRYLADANAYFPRESGMAYRTSDHLTELYDAVLRRVAPVRDPALDWKASANLGDAEIEQMKRLSAVRGIPASNLPEQSLLLLQRGDGKLTLVSLIHNSAHSNVAQLFDEESRRLPEEDTLVALDGVVGAYPNALFVVQVSDLPDFVTAVSRLVDAGDLTRLMDRFGVRRTDPRFWGLSDALHAEFRRRSPDDAAVLDYSRLKNN